jgi:hypothetical protein
VAAFGRRQIRELAGNFKRESPPIIEFQRLLAMSTRCRRQFFTGNEDHEYWYFQRHSATFSQLNV